MEPHPLTPEQRQQLLELVSHAGAASLPYWQQDVQVLTKQDSSPVTAADLAANSLLLQGLPAILDIPVLSEESCNISQHERAQWDLWWLVDPLDGTREFIQGSPEYTCNVALMQHELPLYGVVGLPASGELYHGGLGLGATFCSGSQQHALSIHAPAHPLRVAGSRSHGSAAQQDFIERLQRIRPLELRTAGSSLKFCWLAAGKIDLYPRFSPTSQWDTAAGQAVLEGAGGKVMDSLGNRLTYPVREHYLNPFFVASCDDALLQQQVVQLWPAGH